MSQDSYGHDPAEAALAKEFAEYLGSVSKEIVDPIKRNVERHQQEVDKLIASVTESRQRLEATLASHEGRMSSTSTDVVKSLQSLSTAMKTTVESISAGHEATRQRLISLFSEARVEQSQNVEKLFAALRKECIALTEQQTAIIGKTVLPMLMSPISAHFRRVDDSVAKYLKSAEEGSAARDELLRQKMSSLDDALRATSGKATFALLCALVSAIGVVILLIK